VDANAFTARIDVWADISWKLPFRNNSVAAFYSHHVIEHLPDSRLAFHLEEMFRCLRPGGVIRVGGPNADVAIRKFQENDLNWFSDFPDKRNSIGGRFANFILCRGEHLTILTASYLTELAGAAGFDDIRFCRSRTETMYPDIIDSQVLASEWDEKNPDEPHTLIMEARKSN
jgi:SAM-dependent methyltransferase